MTFGKATQRAVDVEAAAHLRLIGRGTEPLSQEYTTTLLRRGVGWDVFHTKLRARQARRTRKSIGKSAIITWLDTGSHDSTIRTALDVSKSSRAKGKMPAGRFCGAGKNAKHGCIILNGYRTPRWRLSERPTIRAPERLWLKHWKDHYRLIHPQGDLLPDAIGRVEELLLNSFLCGETQKLMAVPSGPYSNRAEVQEQWRCSTPQDGIASTKRLHARTPLFNKAQP